MTTASTRTRTAAVLAGVIAAGLALAGCGGGATPEESSSPAAVDDAFPVTIDTAYGEITVSEKPERILVLSTTYLELLPYLDEAPLASPDNDADIAEWSPWLVGTDRGEIDSELIDSDYLI